MHRRRSRNIKVIVISVLLLLAIILPTMFKLNSFRKDIEQIMSEHVGHKVEISGDISMYILPVPHIKIRNITVYDNKNIKFLHAHEVDVFFTMRDMFLGNISISKLDILESRLYLDNLDITEYTLKSKDRKLQDIHFINAKISLRKHQNLSYIRIIDADFSIQLSQKVNTESTDIVRIKGNANIQNVESVFDITYDTKGIYDNIIFNNQDIKYTYQRDKKNIYSRNYGRCDQ